MINTNLDELNIDKIVENLTSRFETIEEDFTPVISKKTPEQLLAIAIVSNWLFDYIDMRLKNNICNKQIQDWLMTEESQFWCAVAKINWNFILYLKNRIDIIPADLLRKNIILHKKKQ